MDSPGAINARAYLKSLERRASDATDAGLPYYGTVTAVSGAQVAVTTLSADTPSQELVARLNSVASVGDYGICIPVAGGSYVFARIASVADLPLIPIDLALATKASTTNTGTYVTQVTGSVSLSPGTYGCEIRASGILWRSVATGESRIQLRVGGLSVESIVSSVDGLVMTTPVTMIARALRTASSAPIVVATTTVLTIALDFRGGTVAGTTNIINAEIHGSMYRIS